MDARIEDLTAINEIGPEIATSIVQFFHEPKNKEVMEKFRKAGVKPQKKEIAADNTLQGKSFVFTGTLKSMARNEAKSIVENLGGSVHASVTKRQLMLLPEANRVPSWIRPNHWELQFWMKKNF